MAIIYIVFSAIITALANLLIRNGFSHVDGSKGDPFIIHRFLTAGLMMLPIILFRHGSIAFDWSMLFIGIAAGLALGTLQYSLGKSLHYGPPGLSFIFVSSACVVPPMIMSSLFGKAFGHGYTLTNFTGSALVIAGLYWMTKSLYVKTSYTFEKWLKWISLGFLGGIVHMLIMQWRALLLKDDLPASPLLPCHPNQTEGDMYMVVAFITAALCQLAFSKPTQIKTTLKQKAIYGIFGGIMSSLSTLLLLLGTETAANDSEKAILFPLNTVLLICLCNLWARMFYKEQVNWPANALSLAGIAVAVV